MAKPIIIKDWQKGMAASPNQGMGLVRNASVDAATGALTPNYAPAKISPVASSTTVTFDPATDLGTLVGAFAALATNVAVTFTSTGTLPAPLVAGTNYFLIMKSASTFKLATCIKNCGGGTGTGFSEVDIDITTAGTGTHTMATVDVGPIGAECDINLPDNFVTQPAASNLPARQSFYIDTNGRVWFYAPQNYPGQLLLLDGNSLSGPKGQGICAFQTANINRRYLFTYRTLFMDVCDIRSMTYLCDPVGNSAWTTAWQGVTGQNYNSQYTMVGDDNIMYFCNGSQVGSLQEIPGSTFAPGTPATYTFNSSALTLPQGEMAVWLEQLGINLLVAGGTNNKIYPWDRSSPSFGLPIYCAEQGVFRLKNINNTVYIMNGIRGNIYKTQGAIVVFAGKIPEYASGSGNPNVQWGGVGEKSGNLLVGVYCPNNTANSGTWQLTPDGHMTIDNQPSTGAAVVSAMSGFGDEFYTFGYSGGVDLIGTTRYGSFGTVAQSALYEAGDKTHKSTYSQLEVQLNQPTSGSSSQIRVSYRTKLSGSFTVLATFTTDATSTSFKSDVGLTDIENIQVQVELTGTGNNDEALELLEVRLYP